MTAYETMDRRALEQAYREALASFEAAKARKQDLNMARGKPGAEQLALSEALLRDDLSDADFGSGVKDLRNYGMLTGLPAAKDLFADLLGCKPSECLIGGNSSLQLMYLTLAFCVLFGRKNSPRPWKEEPCVKWLCPVPGYDRHFRITEQLGVKMIAVPLSQTGPDMDLVEELVKDPQVKGMWCVPKFSNPDGITYSEETVRRMASLRPAAKDFTVIWDNAYCLHEFDGPFQPFPEILSLARTHGNPDMFFEFASTSKITFPGAGISALASSEENIAWIENLLAAQIISFDKINQLRHVRFLKDRAHTLELMRRHAEILKPKFDCVLQTLEREIGPLGIAHWRTPKGGYFISLYTAPGLARRTLTLCAEAGVVMTGAGATYPYGLDPEDSNIRIAPSFPPLEELKQAIEVFCICLKLAALEQLLA